MPLLLGPDYCFNLSVASSMICFWSCLCKHGLLDNTVTCHEILGIFHINASSHIVNELTITSRVADTRSGRFEPQKGSLRSSYATCTLVARRIARYNHSSCFEAETAIKWQRISRQLRPLRLSNLHIVQSIVGIAMYQNSLHWVRMETLQDERLPKPKNALTIQQKLLFEL